jgi:hypothetical protein
MNHLNVITSSRELRFYDKYLDIIESNNYKESRFMIEACVKLGKIEYLAHVYENGKNAKKNTIYLTLCDNASRYGQLICLQYGHDNGCMWYEGTCLYAAMNGHIDCLRYALSHGCPHNKSNCIRYTTNQEKVKALFKELRV